MLLNLAHWAFNAVSCVTKKHNCGLWGWNWQAWGPERKTREEIYAYSHHASHYAPVSVTHKMSVTVVWFANDQHESVFHHFEEFFKPKQQGASFNKFILIDIYSTLIFIIYGKGN